MIQIPPAIFGVSEYTQALPYIAVVFTQKLRRWPIVLQTADAWQRHPQVDCESPVEILPNSRNHVVADRVLPICNVTTCTRPSAARRLCDRPFFRSLAVASSSSESAVRYQALRRIAIQALRIPVLGAENVLPGFEKPVFVVSRIVWHITFCRNETVPPCKSVSVEEYGQRLKRDHVRTAWQRYCNLCVLASCG